jgi:hypothetical protein
MTCPNVNEFYNLRNSHKTSSLGVWSPIPTPWISEHLQNTDLDRNIHALALVNISLIEVMMGANKEAVQHNLGTAKTRSSTIKYFHGVTFLYMVLADLKLREWNTISAKDILQDSLKSWNKQ